MRVSVVGMNYRMTPSSQDMLSEHVPQQVTITREPENKHDGNAIAVNLTTWRKGMHIGYLPKDVAEKLAPLLDFGEVAISTVWLTDVDSSGSGSLLITFRKRLS